MKLKNRMLLALAASSLIVTTQLWAADDMPARGKGWDDRGAMCDKNAQRGMMCDREGMMPPPGMRHHGKGMFIMKMVSRLDLSKDQQAALKKVMQEFRSKRQNLMAAFTKEGFDKKAYIEARTNKRAEMLQARADMIESIYAILTASQKAELYEMIQKMGEKGRFNKNMQQ